MGSEAEERKELLQMSLIEQMMHKNGLACIFLFKLFFQKISSVSGENLIQGNYDHENYDLKKSD